MLQPAKPRLRARLTGDETAQKTIPQTLDFSGRKLEGPGLPLLAPVRVAVTLKQQNLSPELPNSKAPRPDAAQISPRHNVFVTICQNRSDNRDVYLRSVLGAHYFPLKKKAKMLPEVFTALEVNM